MKLYHWTCLDHGAEPIMQTGMVIPNAHPLLGFKFSWWSHIPWASRESLGLSSRMLTCDRMGQQFVADVEDGQVTRWQTFRAGVLREYPDRIGGVRQLEAATGTRPDWWWVAPDPVRVALVLEMSR